MKILADASLPCLSALFPPPFQLSFYHHQDELIQQLPTQDILLCRSTLKVSATLLNTSAIQCVATASSGIDHIDVDYLYQHNIKCFDAKGCNANAVADYVVASLAYLSQHQPVIGKQAGIIGMGEVGSRVEKRLKAANFDVICYDPFKEMLGYPYRYETLDTISQCDLLCIHANLHANPPYPSMNLIDTNFLHALKPHMTIINASRGGIVNEAALLTMNKPITYCTDVYSHEPTINANIVDLATLCTPHIAGHSIEAKKHAVFCLSQQLHDHYGYPMPLSVDSGQERKHPLKFLSITKLDWQDIVLEQYNPMEDTLYLKKATDKTHAFLAQRKAHQNRHDFKTQIDPLWDLKTQVLLGC